MTDWQTDPDFDDDGELDVEWYPIPPGLQAAVDELSAVPETPFLKSRARHIQTGFGHRDNLQPGMELAIRKAHCRTESDETVAVLDDGCFGWNGKTYQNGNQLLKAIYGKKDHRMTVRRYFGLGGEESNAVTSLFGQIREALLEKAIVVRRNRVIYITGDLEKAGLPAEFQSDEGSVSLEPNEARRLLKLIGGDNAA